MKGILAISLAVLVSSPALAESSGCESPFLFEVNPTLSLTDIAHFAPEETFENPSVDNRILTVQQYDEEDYPIRNGKRGVAIVYAATGDLGEPGLGGRLWSKVVTDLDKDQMKALDRAKGGVNVVFVTRKPLGKCGRQSFSIKFDDAGDIYANGRKIGNMQ